MNRILVATASAGFILLAACAQQPVDTGPTKPDSVPLAQRSPGIDLTTFDKSVQPQDDLYRAVNGAWLDSTVIPPDRSNYGAFSKIEDDTRVQLRAIVEELAARQGKTSDTDEGRVGLLFESYMDEATIEALGTQPINDDLSIVEGIRTRTDIAAAFARLNRAGIDAPILVDIQPDARDSRQYTAVLRQGGLSLPNRDFYIGKTPQFAALRSGLEKHIAKMFRLAKWQKPDAAAAAVVALEAKLAAVQWDKEDLRKPLKIYNPYATDKLDSLSVDIAWPQYLQAAGINALPGLVVQAPPYLVGLGRLVRDESIETWKNYFRWQILTARAGMLPRAFVEESFAFNGRTLNGTEADLPRWKKGVDLVDADIGMALGRFYVQKTFPAEHKARMETLVKNLIAAYGQQIDTLEWMSPETRQAAHDKLSKFDYQIGYPNRWRDYSKLTFAAGELLANDRRAAQFEYQRNLDKLGTPTDREEWHMTPQTVNAYYTAEQNQIVFPAAILHPPFFDMAADDAANYGAIGAIIGHEITHGFDDQGSQYDGDGNLRMWWTTDDRQKFEALGARLAAQYDTYEPIRGMRLNGSFTLGENIADLGGMRMAYAAYKVSLGGREGPVIAGLTADERFFMGWAQAWRRKYREENLRVRMQIDPHSPSQYRCNGVVTNMPEFYAAFDVREGDKLYRAPADRIRIW